MVKHLKRWVFQKWRVDTVEGRLNLKNLNPCFIVQHSSDHTWYMYIYLLLSGTVNAGGRGGVGADWSVKLIVIATKEWRGCARSAHCFIVCLFAVIGQGLLDGDNQWEMSFSLSLCQQEFTIWLIYLFRPWRNSARHPPPLTPPPAPLQNSWNHQNYFSLLNLY